MKNFIYCVFTKILIDYHIFLILLADNIDTLKNKRKDDMHV